LKTSYTQNSLSISTQWMRKQSLYIQYKTSKVNKLYKTENEQIKSESNPTHVKKGYREKIKNRLCWHYYNRILIKFFSPKRQILFELIFVNLF
jgi:hypothetical protein